MYVAIKKGNPVGTLYLDACIYDVKLYIHRYIYVQCSHYVVLFPATLVGKIHTRKLAQYAIASP